MAYLVLCDSDKEYDKQACGMLNFVCVIKNELLSPSIATESPNPRSDLRFVTEFFSCNDRP